MSHPQCLFLLFAACLARGQGVDTVVLLNPSTTLRQLSVDGQGNLLVAALNGTTVTASKYNTQGQLLQSFSGPGQTLNTGANDTVLAADSAGALYLGASHTLLRPAGNPPVSYTLNFAIRAIAFDSQNHPILAGTQGEVAKLDPATGKILAQFTLPSNARPTGIAVDGSGSVYIVGNGDSPSGIQGFIAKLDANLQQVFFNSLDPGLPNSIAIDSAGNLYIAETPFAVPVTIGPPNGGAIVKFGANKVLKLSAAGTILASNDGGGNSIAIDGNGNVVVVGGSYAPTGAFQTACGPRTDLGGLSISLLDPVKLQPIASAFLAQQSLAGASGVAPDGSVFVGLQPNRIVRVRPGADSSPVACIVNGASYRVDSSIVGGQLITIFGRGLGTDPLTAFDDSKQLPFSVNGTSVKIGGFPAALLAVSSTQINAIVPYELDRYEFNPIPQQIEISRNGNIIYTWPMIPAIRTPIPLVTFDASGKLDILQAPAYQDALATYPVPLALVINADGTLNTASNPAPRGSTVRIIATGFGPLSGPETDGAPAGNPPEWPTAIHPGLGLPTVADIPVQTAEGALDLPLDNAILTIAGHSNSLLQITGTVPTYFTPGPVPFFIGDWPATGSPVWTNFFYIR